MPGGALGGIVGRVERFDLVIGSLEFQLLSSSAPND